MKRVPMTDLKNHRVIVSINAANMTDKDIIRIIQERLEGSLRNQPHPGVFRSGLNVKSYSRVVATENRKKGP